MSDNDQLDRNQPLDKQLDSVDKSLENAEKALIDELSKGKGKKYVRFVMAALGSIPWIGSYLSILGSIGGLDVEFDQEKLNSMQKLWLEEHRQKLNELGRTLDEIFTRLDGFGEEVQRRIESEEYLTLVKSVFRSWDQSETQEKRIMFKKLITNTGASSLCTDDLVRLFIKWINQYHESHFLVIREIYKEPGITRFDIWNRLYDSQPRDDSAEADLYRYLIRDLSTGGVIRQERKTNEYGEFIKKQSLHRRKSSMSRTMESAFEKTKPYELTELGKQFVHYVLEDVVKRIETSE
ncbi:hypothetical protein ACFL1P_00965 [Patescibacteria group bacterium]